MIIKERAEAGGRCYLQVAPYRENHLARYEYAREPMGILREPMCILRENVSGWINENIPSTLWYTGGTNYPHSVVIIFQTKEDAAIFKLFWTNNTVEES